MKFHDIKYIFVLLVLMLLFGTCRVDNNILIKTGGNYPKDIGMIMMNKCAVSGCHNDISKEAASGLSLTSWNKLFEGTRNGAAVIPYNHGQSTMFLFCNTFDDLGVSAKPTMPINAPALTKDEVVALRNWIDNGAPDDKGFVKFSDNPNRSKYYVCNQGCDLITVFDAETDLPIRCFEAGQFKNRIESPHQVRVAPDGQHYYVILLNGTVLQKFRASDDTYVSQAYIESGSWNTFIITKDSKHAFAVDYSASDGPAPGQGRVKYIDLASMEVKATYVGSGLFSYPHAVALNSSEDVLYVFGQEASFFYKVNMKTNQGNSPFLPEISGMITLDQSNGLLLKPHDCLFTADGSRYIVSCQNTNEIRVYNTADDKLVKVIPVGAFPQELAIAESKQNLFVTCMEDAVNFPGKRGSVAVIDLNTLTLIKYVYTGHQPHGITVNETKSEVIVVNRNTASGGPAPHHTTACGGRNGYISYIDLNTLEMIPGKKVEVSVDPYFVSLRK